MVLIIAVADGADVASINLGGEADGADVFPTHAH